MKINLIGSSSETSDIDEQRNNAPAAPGIEAAFPNLVPDNTVLDWTLIEGKFIWHTYEAPDGSPPPSDEEIWHEYRRAFLRWNSRTEEMQLFSTPLRSSFPVVDLKQIKQDCLDLAARNPQKEISNRGGYQGHGFFNQGLYDAIADAIPPRPVNSPYDFEVEEIQAWVNINGKGDANVVHDHKGLGGHTVWSGVFYVEVPNNSGSITFMDPRIGMLSDANHLVYDGSYHFELKPEAGQLILFPPWLRHYVLPNKQSLERISVAFNVNGKPLENK